MPKTTPAEWLLARLTDRDRAAAIYGDLEELATTRGRVWFYAAYLRTLAVLSWRFAAAVIVGMTLRQILVNTLFHAHLQQAPGPHFPLLLLLWFDPSVLWFFLPFAAVLYGVRDRFVRFTAIATLGTTIAFLFQPRISFAAAVVMLVLAASTLFLSGWRKQAGVLAATVAFTFGSAFAAGTLSMYLRSHGYIPAYGHGVLGLEPMLAFRGSMLASAYLCARLYRWLLDRPTSTAAA